MTHLSARNGLIYWILRIPYFCANILFISTDQVPTRIPGTRSTVDSKKLLMASFQQDCFSIFVIFDDFSNSKALKNCRKITKFSKKKTFFRLFAFCEPQSTTINLHKEGNC